MGGRGSSSSGKHGKISGVSASGKPRVFYDRTADFAGMSLHEFENAIRGKSIEYLGGFDSNGNLIVAGNGGKGSVALPTGHPDFAKITMFTHNHPSNADRPLGGTFSTGDITILGKYPQLNSIRAVANGKGEHSYIMQKSSGGKANPSGLQASAANIKNTSELKKLGNETIKKMQANLGRPLTRAETNRAYIGGMKNAWKDVAAKNGYDYITLKKAPW